MQSEENVWLFFNNRRIKLWTNSVRLVRGTDELGEYITEVYV